MSGASEQANVRTSERANGRASGPVLTSLFLFVPDHSAPHLPTRLHHHQQQQPPRPGIPIVPHITQQQQHGPISSGDPRCAHDDDDRKTTRPSFLSPSSYPTSTESVSEVTTITSKLPIATSSSSSSSSQSPMEEAPQPVVTMTTTSMNSPGVVVTTATKMKLDSASASASSSSVSSSIHHRMLSQDYPVKPRNPQKPSGNLKQPVGPAASASLSSPAFLSAQAASSIDAQPPTLQPQSPPTATNLPISTAASMPVIITQVHIHGLF